MAKDPLFYLRGPLASIASDFQKRIGRIYWMGIASLRAVREDGHKDPPAQCGLPCIGLDLGGFRWDATGVGDTEDWLRGNIVRSAFEQLWHHHRFLWSVLKLEEPGLRKQLGVKIGTSLTNQQVEELVPKEFRNFDRGGLRAQIEFCEKTIGYRPWLADEVASLNELRAALTHGRSVWEGHRGHLYVLAPRIESTLDHTTDVWFPGGVPPEKDTPRSRSQIVLRRREIRVGAGHVVRLNDEDVLDIVHTLASYGNAIASCLAAHREGKRWPECVLGQPLTDWGKEP